MKLILDTGVVGQICHPRKHDDVRAWFATSINVHEMLLPEAADYELRRELLRIGAKRSLRRLDELSRELRYLPCNDGHLEICRKHVGASAPNRKGQRG